MLQQITHDLISSAHQLSSDEHRRHGRVTAEPQQHLLDLPASRDLVELVHSRVDTKVDEKRLDRVAHAAGAPAEQHHWPLAHHSCHPLHLLRKKGKMQMGKGSEGLTQRNKPKIFEEFKEEMAREFEMADIGLMSYYLGIEVKQREDGIFISQEAYAKEILKRYGMVWNMESKYPNMEKETKSIPHFSRVLLEA
ncbi:hypothetical protein RJ639_027489 [Escallonia herrerae]|uniref:Reverse transcriptase Ty1/copia-type domain-containing protein n=1 Tax=Escallonia herrerae TaxID=1293975 RepID=A0AA88X5I5_9ASTE|nr:hypothetical protein RJ639_027489 [Escallonia herrerae]